MFQLDWSRDLLAGARGLSLARERGWLLAWDEANWQTTLAAGRNDKQPGDTSDALLLESALMLERLPDREAWIGAVDEALAQQSEGCVVLLDIDGLAAINAEHGTRVGDYVLTQLARAVGPHGSAALATSQKAVASSQ